MCFLLKYVTNNKLCLKVKNIGKLSLESPYVNVGQVIRNTEQDHDKFTYAVKNTEISKYFMKASHELGSNFMEI